MTKPRSRLPDDMRIHKGENKDIYDFDMHALSSDPSEALNYLRNYCLSHGYTKEKWEEMTMETQLRESLKRQNAYAQGLTAGLMDSLILGVIHARMSKNNRIATLPQISYATGNLCCMVCSEEPVVSCFSLVPSNNPVSSGWDDDISFVFFICKKHASDPDLLRHDIIDRNIWIKCYEMREEFHLGV